MRLFSRLFVPPALVALVAALGSALPARAAVAPGEAHEASAMSSIAALGLPAVTQTRLDNGLTVVLEENPRAPFVAMRLEYDAGSRDDPPGKAGLASITRRLMLESTKHVAHGEYEATLDRMGAFDRGWGTSLDVTQEWATVPADAVDTVLWLWSDQMGFFAPTDPKALADVRAAQARERASRVDDVQLGALNGIVLRALFPDDHPYHLAPLEGSAEDATLADVRAFHDAHFAPSRAVLTLVGDFASPTLLERVRAYFGPIAAGPPPEAPKLTRAQLEADVHLDVVANVKAAEVWLDWRTPPFYDAGDAELDVFAGGIAGSRTNALYWSLIDQQHVATRVTARQISHALGSDYRITATVAPGHKPEDVVSAIETIVKNFAARGFSDPSFRGARSHFTVPFVHSLDRADRRASVYAGTAVAHRDPTSFAAGVGRYDALTFADVRTAATQWLLDAHHVVTIVTPDPSAPLAGALRSAGGAK